MLIIASSIFLNVIFSNVCVAFAPDSYLNKGQTVSLRSKPGNQDEKIVPKGRKDNKAMAFLRRKGLVGVTKDFTNAIGIDEGEGGKNGPDGKFRKSKEAYQNCVKSGIIDNFSQSFPVTSSGFEWSGFSDRVIGGVSTGSIVREVVNDRACNVLRGEVSLENNGGFIQMAVDLADLSTSSKFVDVSGYDGIELEVFHGGESEIESFNIHLKTPDCISFSAYRCSFELPKDTWKTIRLPWSEFKGYDVEVNFDPSKLRRVAIVAIGKEMKVSLAVSSVGFYNVFEQ